MVFGRFKMPRARFWLPLAAVVVFALCIRFDLHYHVIGFCRGDAYYQGLPTSYWRDAATYRIHGPPAWLRPVHRWLPRPRHEEWLSVFKGGVEALPVLRQLAEDQDTDLAVRVTVLRIFVQETAFHIRDLENVNDTRPLFVPEVYDIARRCFDDPNADVRRTAAELLLYSDDSEPAFQFLLQLSLQKLQDTAPIERMQGITVLSSLMLHCQGEAQASLLKHIRAMEADPNRGVRDHAKMLSNFWKPS